MLPRQASPAEAFSGHALERVRQPLFWLRRRHVTSETYGLRSDSVSRSSSRRSKESFVARKNLPVTRKSCTDAKRETKKVIGSARTCERCGAARELLHTAAALDYHLITDGGVVRRNAAPEQANTGSHPCGHGQLISAQLKPPGRGPARPPCEAS